MQPRLLAFTLTACLALLLMPSCGFPDGGPRSRYQLADGRWIPSEWPDQFKARNHGMANLRPNYEALYVYDGPTTYTYRTWFRFWPEGQVMTWLDVPGSPAFEDADPTPAAGDTFQSGIVGRWRVEGERIVMVFTEVEGSRPRYVRLYAIIRNDGALVVGAADDSGGISARSALVYAPVPVEGMQRLPDW